MGDDRIKREEEVQTDEDLVNYLGPGNILEGKFNFRGGSIIIGTTINGKLNSENSDGELFIGPNSKVTGDIRAENIVLGGEMEGKIYSGKVKVIDGGVFSGDIWTNRGLTIESGAKISARIKMKGISNPTKRATGPGKQRTNPTKGGKGGKDFLPV